MHLTRSIPLLSSISKRNTFTFSKNPAPKILLTGSLGQIGSELTNLFRNKYGSENVIASDIKKPPKTVGKFYCIDVTSKESIERVVVEEGVDLVVHLSSILSATGERDPDRAIQLNVRGIENILQVAKLHNLRVYAPSSIAAFGKGTPLDHTEDIVPMRPSTIYGVTKVYLELLGEYYFSRFGIDFRSLRYPGVISSETLPGGGTTDYAVDIYWHALKFKKFTCYLEKNVSLPMMYMPDCLRGTVELIEADPTKLTQRTYNLAAVSFTPEEIADSIRKYIPEFEINYVPDFRNDIALSWPRSLDDSKARDDWGWKHEYDLDAMTKVMLENIKKKIIL